MFMVRSWVSLIMIVVLAACSDAGGTEVPMDARVYPLGGMAGNSIEILIDRIAVSVRYDGDRDFRVRKKFDLDQKYRVEAGSDVQEPLLINEYWHPVRGSVHLGREGAKGVRITIQKGTELVTCHVGVSRARKSAWTLAECD